jgi:hypothetical protein
MNAAVGPDHATIDVPILSRSDCRLKLTGFVFAVVRMNLPEKLFVAPMGNRLGRAEALVVAKGSDGFARDQSKSQSPPLADSRVNSRRASFSRFLIPFSDAENSRLSLLKKSSAARVLGKARLAYVLSFLQFPMTVSALKPLPRAAEFFYSCSYEISCREAATRISIWRRLEAQAKGEGVVLG